MSFFIFFIVLEYTILSVKVNLEGLYTILPEFSSNNAYR